MYSKLLMVPGREMNYESIEKVGRDLKDKIHFEHE